MHPLVKKLDEMLEQGIIIPVTEHMIASGPLPTPRSKWQMHLCLNPHDVNAVSAMVTTISNL